MFYMFNDHASGGGREHVYIFPHPESVKFQKSEGILSDKTTSSVVLNLKSCLENSLGSMSVWKADPDSVQPPWSGGDCWTTQSFIDVKGP